MYSQKVLRVLPLKVLKCCFFRRRLLLLPGFSWLIKCSFMINSRPTQPTYRFPNPRRRSSSAFFRLVRYLVDSSSVIFRIFNGSIVCIFTRRHCWWWLLRLLYARWPPRTTGWLSTRSCLEYLMERLYHWSLSLPEMLLVIIGCHQL